ncbi:ATP-binding protein [Empedobacter falsenii]
MNTIEVQPNLSNFINSFREIGYTPEVAIADILDNSITAKSTEIQIFTGEILNPYICIVDNGLGMDENELIEAMRLASKNSKDNREQNDLGRFGLGLKTASFSQCKKLTVVSKKNNQIQAKQWYIDLIISSNKWLLKEIDNFELIPNIEILNSHETGTMVLWENIDKIEFKNFSTIVKELRDHLSLVFHKYLEGFSNKKKLEIYINNNKVEPFNPFNYKNLATQELAEEKLILANKEVIIQPYILPHHSKVSDNAYNERNFMLNSLPCFLLA